MSDGSSSSRPVTSTRPKTAFQTLNSRFEKVLSELRGVHLRTMKPASLPPITSMPSRQDSLILTHWNGYFQGLE